jgi:site-specific recombinase XerD
MSTVAITGAFTAYLMDERHFSPYTARCYGADLRQYVEFLADELGMDIDEAREKAAYDHRLAHPGPGSGAPSSITAAICAANPDTPRPPGPARSPPFAPSTSGPSSAAWRTPTP